jgi:hypothetical protein
MGLEPITLRSQRNILPVKLLPLSNKLTLTGLEPASSGLQGQCSTIKLKSRLRSMGFEPTYLRRWIYNPLHHHSATTAYLRWDLNPHAIAMDFKSITSTIPSRRYCFWAKGDLNPWGSHPMVFKTIAIDRSAICPKQ